MKTTRSVLLAVFTALLTASTMLSAFASPGYFRQPTLHGDTIVFVAEGDLWRTSRAGGAAQRLTTHSAAESSPSISLDGTQVAFTARYEGPAEVYVMPLAGGPPTRLTYDGDTANVQGWSLDGRVLYSSTRYSGKPEQRLYTVNPTTREVRPLPLAEAAEGCFVGTQLFFARLPQTSDNMKRYEGGLAQKIWRFDVAANTNVSPSGEGEAMPLTSDYAGTSRQPMCSLDRVYFLSDRDGTMNIWSMNLAGKDTRQHTKHTTFDIRGASISPDGRRIAYQRGAEIFVLDIVTNTDQRVEISLQSDFDQLRTRWVKTPWDFVTAVEPSPNGDKVVITARGQAFVAPVGAGRRVDATRVSALRARNAVFTSDGKSILAFSDQTGEVELWRYPANGVGAPVQLTKDGTTQRRRAFPSPDGKWIAHHDKERRLYLLNSATGENREIDRSRHDQFDEVVWSPDSRWLVIEKSAENYFETLCLIEIATGKKTAITSDRYHARSATFSPDGKWLYFLGDRHLQSLVGNPWGQRNPEPFFDRQSKMYALALDPAARWPFLPKDELQRAEPDKKADANTGKGDKPAAATTTETVAKNERTPKENLITFAGLADRLYEVPVSPGNYGQLSTDGKRLYVVVTETSSERKQSLRSVAIEAPHGTAHVLDVFFDEIRSYRLTADRKKILIRKANDLWVFDAGKSAPAAADQGKFAVNLRDWSIEVDPREEWQQMFVDAWRMHRDYFYDKNMHGVDWKAIRRRYEPLVALVTERGELNDVLAQMTSHLSALHSQVGGAELRRGEDSIDVAALAADVVKTEAGFRITKLFNGDWELIEERGPLARAEVGLGVGDTIIAVNGRTAQSVSVIGELLRNQVGKQVLLQVADASGKKREVIVTPISARRDKELRYLAWEHERRMRVDAEGAQKIGYVHLQAMGGADIARWAREFYPIFQREGLIIDLRNNGGGSIDSWIIEKLQRRAWHFWKRRDSDDVIHNQQLAFRGHVVAIINANTYSDGETMAQGLRRLGIATLIGKTTAGAGIWLSDQNRLRDNGLARAAEMGSFVDDGKTSAWITESVGVKPDIEVDNLPAATFRGGDAQLDAAIQYLKAQMAKSPVSTPKVPPYPVFK